jgi:transcriptional regulator with XRE-family HTH domain
LHFQRERVARGLTQRRFAEQHGVSQSWLARFELGQSRTSINRVADLFAAFGLQLRVDVEIADELRLHVTKETPRSVSAKAGDRDVRIIPLADLEPAFPNIAQIMERWRSGLWSDGSEGVGELGE